MRPLLRPEPPVAAERITGHIQRIVSEKGFFFIRDEAGRDYFAHRSELLNVEMSKLMRGDRVHFLPTDHVKGARAVEIEWVGADGRGHH